MLICVSDTCYNILNQSLSILSNKHIYYSIKHVSYDNIVRSYGNMVSYGMALDLIIC